VVNVFPFTKNGRVASPLSVIAGALMPPRAQDEVELVEVAELADETVVLADDEAVEVELENAWAAIIGVAVATGASTVTMLVTTAHVEAVACAKTACVVVG